MKQIEKQILREAERAKKLAEKELRKAERAEQKAQREAEKERKRIERAKSEEQLVQEYANNIIRNSGTRGFTGNQKSNREIWEDQDFYFSVVFQTEDQKVDFINFLVEKHGVVLHTASCPNIINGLDLAKKMGCTLDPVLSKDYPLANMELRPFILDKEY